MNKRLLALGAVAGVAGIACTVTRHRNDSTDEWDMSDIDIETITYEDESGVGRIVQRGSNPDEEQGTYVSIERRDSPNAEWEESVTLGDKKRSAEIDGNKSAPNYHTPFEARKRNN